MTPREFEIQKKRIETLNKDARQRQELKEMRYRAPRKKLSTSKIALLAVFIMCIQIILFCEIAMLKYGDFSALYALIGVPATIVPTLCAYYSKSAKENTEHGITYELAMREQQDEITVG